MRSVLLLVFALATAAKVSGEASCPPLDHVFNNTNVDETIADWLTIGGESFLADLFHDYLTDDSKGSLANIHGSELLEDLSLDYPVCKLLPLNASDCYLTVNPGASFFEHLVANHVPLGNHIVKAMDIVRDYLEEFEQEIHEFLNEFYKTKASGNCIVGNSKMVGMYESGGFPP